MSPYGTIITTYRAEVQVPEDVHDTFFFTRAYGVFAKEAAKGATNSGESSYECLPVQWAEFRVKRDAEDFIAAWHNRILLWQEQMRNEALNYPTTYDQGGTA